MSMYQAESLWMICLNCEHEQAFEEIFTEEGDEIECPFCSSKEFRQCDSLGLDVDSYKLHREFDEYR